MGHYCRDIEFAVDKFYAELHIVFVVLTNHHTGLVETCFVRPAHLDFRLKLAAVGGIEKWAVVDGKSVVGYAPIVGLSRNVHFETAAAYVVRFGFVEPLHFFEILSLSGCGECCC